MFALGSEGEGSDEVTVFLKSMDEGEHWTQNLLCGFPLVETPSLAINPFNDNIIYVGISRYDNEERTCSVYQTTNGGEQWILKSQISGVKIDDMVVDPHSPQRIFMASNKGVFLSKDSGLNWKKVFDTSADALAISLDGSGEIYAGCYDGVFASFDGGQSWIKVSDKSDYPYVHCLEIHEATQNLYAGIHERGIQTYRESEKHVVAIMAGSGGTTKPEPGIYFYPPDAEISITAFPDPHYLFKTWSGSRSEKNNPLKITVDSDVTIKADFYVPLFPPSDFWGEKVHNRSLTMREYINILRWQRNPENSHIVKYELYRIREGISTLVAELDAETFEYWERGVYKDEEYFYSLIAVHVTGEKSDPAFATIR